MAQSKTLAADDATILSRADADLASEDEDTRWQAACALGDFCEDAPEVIWPLRVKWGSCDNEDTRTAIATCVLEHILEYHFATYFAKTARLIRGGSVRFAEMLCICYRFGQAKEPSNAVKFDRLERKARRLVRKTKQRKAEDKK